MTNIFTSTDNTPLYVAVFDGVVDGDNVRVAICPHLGAMRISDEPDGMLGLVAAMQGRDPCSVLAGRFLSAAHDGIDGGESELQPLDYTKFSKLGFCGLTGGKLKGGIQFQSFPDALDTDLSELFDKVGEDDSTPDEVKQVVDDYLHGKNITTFDVNAEETEAGA